MPKNKVTDLITDQEIAFARLILSGTMTDRRAAEAVGLIPDTAAYTKAKPRVRAYMLEHRAAVQQQLVEQDSDLSRRAVDEQRRLNLNREQVLARLWEIANLSPEMTRGSITGQVKALAMIVAIEGLIPDRRAVPAQNKTAPLPIAQIYQAACPPRPAVGLAGQQGKPPTPSQTPNLPKRKMSLPAPPVPACRGACRGNPLTARRQTCLRRPAKHPVLSSTPASPPSPTAFKPLERRHRRLMPACPVLHQTNEPLPR